MRKYILIFNFLQYGEIKSKNRSEILIEKYDLKEKINNNYFNLLISSSILSLIFNNFLSKEPPLTMNLQISFMIICHVFWKYILQRDFLDFHVNYVYVSLLIIFEMLIPLIVEKYFIKNKITI